MSVAIVGKLLGGLVVSGGGIATITYMVISSHSYVELGDKGSNNNIYIYAINKGVAAAQSTAANETNIQEYKCQFHQKDYPCIVSKVEDFDNTTKQTYVDDPNIIDPKVANKEIVASELTTEGTIYKILIHSKIDNWTKTTEDKNKFSIEIIPKTTATGQSTKYASLKPLFAIKSDGLSDQYTKTEYFVVKKNEVSPVVGTSVGITAGVTETTTFSHKCETSNTASGKTTAVETNNCNVYDFSNNDDLNNKTLHTLVFTKPGTATTDTSFSTTNKHYLVQLETSVKVSEVKQIKITLSNSTESFQSKEIIPAIHITEKEEGIFILQKKSST